ncbi:MAG: hypothetical protein JWO44_1269 [Bacteroidetes bacterium]|nr:hypothetical protein [Bacteroidota bacterium]
MKFLYSLLLVLFAVSGMNAQDQEKGNYLDDFNIIVGSLLELHPKLYTNITKDEFDTDVANISQRLLVNSSRPKAIYMIQELFYKLGNSHAGNISVFEDLGITKALPFSVYIIGHDLYIRNYPRDTTLNGLKINAIGNTSAAKLIDSLKIFFPTDGNIPVISYNLQPLFNNLYGFFCSERDTFQLDTEKGPMKFAAALRGDKIFEEVILKKSEVYFGTDRFLKKEIRPGYGYFRFIGFIPSYKGFEIEKEYYSFIKEANAKQLKAIVIDLRSNNGGDPYLMGRMTAMLSDHPFRLFERIYITETGVPFYMRYMDNHYTYRVRHLKSNEMGDLREVVRLEKGLKVIQPSPERFKGKIYIITGSITQSSSTMMCKYLQGQSNVTFVGSEPIGSINYFWASSHCQITLPELKTKFSFGMELLELKKFSSNKELPTGLIPDHEINYTIEERLAKKDKEMEFIISELRQ